jgi:hypothetical protein
MKKSINHLCTSILLASLFLLQGCIKDSCTHAKSYSWFEPVYKTAEEIRANIKSNPARNIQSPGKLFVIGHYIFLNEVNKGIHIIDNSNPAMPVNKAFIDIPGNVDVAVKGNFLYADLYTDLIALDITNPLQVVTTKIIDNVFPNRNYGFASTNRGIIYDWVRHDTTITEDCTASTPEISPWNGGDIFFLSTTGTNGPTSLAGGVPSGIAGSMARFTLINNYLYTVGDADLKVIDIAAPAIPVLLNTININWGIETIYPFKDRLFIGGNAGMYIYNVANATAPVQMGTFNHARVCDPVIADDNYAYVTLRNGSTCAGFLNELDIIDIRNLEMPVFVKKYDLTNPHGLSKDGNLLFICDGADGLKIFDAAVVNNIQMKKHIAGIDTYDVIAYNGLAMVVAKDGLYQFDYSDNNNIHQVSKIAIAQ